jgi:hypothetical protein
MPASYPRAPRLVRHRMRRRNWAERHRERISAGLLG